jgi:hypothetical protein
MEKSAITSTDAADLNAHYLRTALDGEQQIRVNTEEKESLIRQIGEDMLAHIGSEFDPTNAAELVRQAAVLEGQNIELGYRVKNADARARILYESKEGNIALREAALAEAALADVHIDV